MIIRVIDTETTGVDPEQDRLVEIASIDVLVSADGGNVVDPDSKRQTLVNPGIPIPPEASAIHHIIDADVANAPSGEDAIAGFMGADIYAAHNAKFDAAFLPSDWTWLCTYKVALRVWPDAPRHSNQVLRYWRGIHNIPGLDRETMPIHRALPDAMTTATLFRDLLRSATVDEMVEWTQQPALLPRFHFGKHANKPLAEIPIDYLQWMLGADFDEDARHTAETEIARRRQ